MTEEVKEVEESEEGSILDNLNRRDFIKGAAAAVGGIAFSSLAATNFEAAAAEGQDYVIVSEVVKGGAGAQGPPCGLTDTFKKGEQIVWHAVLFSGNTGEKINDHEEVVDRDLNVQVTLENGDTVNLNHSEHPPDETPKIYYWAGGYKISPGVSTGKMTYEITAEDKEGRMGKLELFGDKEVDTFPHSLTIEEK